MQHVRIILLALVLTLSSALGGLLSLSGRPPAPSPVPVGSASLLSPHGCYPPTCRIVRDDRPDKASRSRSLGVTPTPKATHRAIRKVTTPSPHVKKPTTRRFTSHRGSLHDVTMYCDTGSRTASGKWPEYGMVATMRRDIPFGTVVTIDGLGKFTVEDRIGSGSEFDIFTHSCSQARNFGRHHLRVSY